MTIASLSLGFNGKQVRFDYPAQGEIVTYVKEILNGQSYPLAPLPKTYAWNAIVDVGANVGAAAIWFRTLAPNARIICFEPNEENFLCLSTNMAAFPGIETYHWGLYSADRTATLHLGRNHCMEHSLVPSSGTGGKVETITLRSAAGEFDRLGLDRVSMLKIDTEGSEVPILESLGKRLERVDQVYVEYHSDEDRRAIDAILGERFLLALAKSGGIHRGNFLYVARDILPWANSWRLPRPTL